MITRLFLLLALNKSALPYSPWYNHGVEYNGLSVVRTVPDCSKT